MIRATVTPHTDLETVVGIPVPADSVFPWPEWPAEGPIELAEVTIAPCVAPPPKLFVKRPEPAHFEIPEAPTVADLGPPLAPRAFVDWLLERLPRHGPVTPIDPSHYTFQRVVAAAKAGLASGRVNPGSNVDVGWAVFLANVEHVVRRCALPPEAAIAVLRPTTRIPDDDLRTAVLDAATSGLCEPGKLRDKIVADFNAESEAARQAKERDEAIRRRAVEPIEVDLSEAGLAVWTSTESNPWGPRQVFRAGPLPIGDVTVPVAFRAQDGEVMVAMGRLQGEGLATMTRSERDRPPWLPDEIAARLREARAREAGGRRYAANDFMGDSRTVEGRAALLAFRTRAAGLVYAMATSQARTALAAWTHECLITLVVAFGGAVNLPNAIDSIQEALRSYVRTSTTSRRYGLNGQVEDLDPAERPWPVGLLAPDSVPRAVLAALGQGNSPWRFGELLRPPSEEDARTIRLQLDPCAFERVIAEVVGDARDVRSQAVTDRLFAEGLLASPKPSIEQHRRIAAWLEGAGFAKGEGTDEQGRRCRVWRRAAVA